MFTPSTVESESCVNVIVAPRRPHDECYNIADLMSNETAFLLEANYLQVIDTRTIRSVKIMKAFKSRITETVDTWMFDYNLRDSMYNALQKRPPITEVWSSGYLSYVEQGCPKKHSRYVQSARLLGYKKNISGSELQILDPIFYFMDVEFEGIRQVYETKTGGKFVVTSYGEVNTIPERLPAPDEVNVENGVMASNEDPEEQETETKYLEDREEQALEEFILYLQYFDESSPFNNGELYADDYNIIWSKDDSSHEYYIAEHMFIVSDGRHYSSMYIVSLNKDSHSEIQLRSPGSFNCTQGVEGFYTAGMYTRACARIWNKYSSEYSVLEDFVKGMYERINAPTIPVSVSSDLEQFIC